MMKIKVSFVIGLTLLSACSNSTMSDGFAPGILTGSGGVASVIVKTSGDMQKAYISTSLANLMTVHVANAGGIALKNVQVDWLVTSGGGSLSSASTVTNASGDTSNSWIAAGAAGNASITASVHGIPSVVATFAETSSVGSPDMLGSNFVSSAESTSSASAVALTTADAVTFTLTSATTVYVDFKAIVTQAGAGATVQVVLNVDGTDDLASTSLETLPSGYSFPSSLVYPKNLSSGVHTLALKYMTSAGTTTWASRLLTVRQLIGPFLAANWVPATEAIPAADSSPYNLATVDSVAFTLTSPQTVLVEYSSTIQSVGGTSQNYIFVDGVQDGTYTSPGNESANTDTVPSFLVVPESLSAGLHTITIKHQQDAVPASWSKRMLRVTQIASPTSSAGIGLRASDRNRTT